MFVFRLTGPIILAVNNSLFHCFTISLRKKKNGVICFHPHQNINSLTVSPAPVHVSLDMQELVAGSDKHS